MEDKFIYFLEKSGKLRNFYNLIDSKNYDEIYNLYGKNIFQKYTPVSVQKREIERCFAEGDFETLRRKYGKLYNVHVKAYKTIEKIKLEKRGLFQSSKGFEINADVNGAIGIMRKVISNSEFNRIVDRGVVITPNRINIYLK